MRETLSSESGFVTPRVLIAFALCSVGVVLGMVSIAPPPSRPNGGTTAELKRERYMPVPGGETDDLDRLEAEWNNRLTYPTGIFNPAWIRRAALQDKHLARAIPAGLKRTRRTADSALALDPNAFTSLGPKPLRMTGCSGCFDYNFATGRINDIVIDPVTPNVAYAGGVGGGVWKTTNCCSSSTSWSVVTDDPLLATITIDTLALDPNNHNTIYAGTGDLNYGSFSMGSHGILKSTDAGGTWTILGADVFGPALPQPAGQFPQYQAVGKVRVDPRNSNNVVAGAKTGLYFSYDGGENWTGPCTTNSFATMRQDITGLHLTDTGTNTRIIAAVGVRGFSTTVQYNLNQNGANGIYKGTIPADGCPSDFIPATTNANGWTGLNATSGIAYVNSTTGNQVGRVDIAVAPSNANYIYAQVQSITPNPNAGCGNAAGCQLSAYRTTDGGTTWSQIPGSTGASLLNCQGTAGDYPQNWYDQGLAVDPNNPNRVFFDTFEVWFWDGSTPVTAALPWNDTTCGYGPVTNNGVHVDQHALAFVPGSSSILLSGNDGGIHGTTNANTATAATDPTWFDMNTGLNTIEFYSGDISGNFATSPNPQANGGAQDNGSMSVTFAGSPTGPVQWQMGKGGDGFYARIDPVGTGTSLRFFQGNNSGGLHRCVNNCTASGASWSSVRGNWTGDTQSFILPYDIFHGGIPGGNDCAAAGVPGGCGHLIAGTTRVWETIAGGNASMNAASWYVTNNPATQNMTKQTLGNRSFITQVKYSPKYDSVAIAGTNDANVWIGLDLGGGVAGGANWINVTGNNTVLPNRPVLGIALDPTVPSANVPVGYAAVGGFDANTPATPGHVFRVACGANCSSFTWQNKSGNLPDIPVDSIIVNPNFPQQVFAGTDWGLYYTDDIAVASPIWYRFDNGLPHSMIWDMQIDRGATTLSAWTRGRGAYVWPLPSGPVPVPVPTSIVSKKNHGAQPFSINLPLTGNPGIECRTGGATGDHDLIFSFASPVTVNGNRQAGVTSGAGDVGTGGVADPDGTVSVAGSSVTVPLTNVENAQTITVTLFEVNDGTNTGNVTVSMGVLLGDVNFSRVVTSADTNLTKAQALKPVTNANFRMDANVTGNITTADTNLVKSKALTRLD